MKKIILFVFMFLLCLTLPVTNETVNATSVNNNYKVEQTHEILENIFEVAENRTAGSVGEREVANYLRDYIDNMNDNIAGLGGLNGTYYKGIDGRYLQYFTFNVEDKIGQSQNVVAIKEANVTTNKTVVLGAHYDSEIGQGANDISGAVSLLILMKNLKTVSLPYNVIFAFYGAQSEICAGSNYFLKNLNCEYKENILMSITLDRVGAGENNYYFCANNKTEYEKFISENLEDYKKLPNNLLYSKTADNGMSYGHLGLKTDNSTFLRESINSVLLTSGEAGQYCFREKLGEKSLTNENDTLENCYNMFGSKFYTNIYDVGEKVINFMVKEEFNNIKIDQIEEDIYEVNLPEFITLGVILGLYFLFCLFFIIRKVLLIKSTANN